MSAGSIRPDRSDAPAESWREAFPIDVAEERVENRRQFIKTMVAASTVLACGQVVLATAGQRELRTVVLSDARMLIDVQLSDLKIGEAAIFHYPDKHSPCIIVRLSENETCAYSQKCTHLACPVVPNVAEGRLDCPCHHGAFDIRSGEVLYGPPKTALPRVDLEISASGMIYVVGMKQVQS